jgi:hypothetical protein
LVSPFCAVTLGDGALVVVAVGIVRLVVGIAAITLGGATVSRVGSTEVVAPSALSSSSSTVLMRMSVFLGSVVAVGRSTINR